MKIKEVKVELVDEDSRFVIKRIITDKGEFFNRRLAVSNGIYSCERKRLNHGKSVFNSPFQTFHINWDNKEEVKTILHKGLTDALADTFKGFTKIL